MPWQGVQKTIAQIATHIPMNPTVLFTVVAVVGGFLITAAGTIATWAALRTNRQAATLSNLKEAADAAVRLAEVRKAEITEQGQRITKLQQDIATRDKEIAVLEGRVQQLTDIVTARPAWEQLTASYAMITQHMDARLAETLAQVDQTRAEIREMHEIVRNNISTLSRKEWGTGHGGPRTG